MIVSLNEVETLSLKACRGAGMSWGLAEEAAHAARWLAAHGWAWDRSLVALLSRRDDLSPPLVSAHDMRPTEEGAVLCPIHVGAAVADLLRPGEHLTLHHVLQPMWLVPFACRWVRLGRIARLTWADGEMEVDTARPEISATATADLAVDRLDWIRVELSAEHSPTSGASPAVARSDGTAVDPSAWQALEARGARTYVAASLRSRIAGAGAGLSDND
jgi:hypothetical protein